MTTSHPHPHFLRRELSALIAGIPHMIGFPPENSLVLYMAPPTSTARATAVRTDLPAPEQVAAVVRHLAATTVVNEAVAVLAVIVGGTLEKHRPLVDALHKVFTAKGIDMAHASWTRTIGHGERWRCYADPRCGAEIPDPQSSAWAAALAVAGVPTYRNRGEMAAQLAPDPPETLARREELLDEQLRNPPTPYTEDDLADDMALVTQVLTDAESSPNLPTLTDGQVVRVARALTRPEVKDECLAVVLSANPEAAERVWTLLVRALPAPERADPAVLLALSSYLRGSGVLAAMSLRTALAANPAHTLALLLEAVLHQGMPPHELRTLLMKSFLRNAGIPDENPHDLDDPPWDPDPPPTEPQDDDTLDVRPPTTSRRRVVGPTRR